MQETKELWVPSPGWEDPLEEETATHSSVLVWRVPMNSQRSLVGYSPWGHKESDMTEYAQQRERQARENDISSNAHSHPITDHTPGVFVFFKAWKCMLS